ncbi:hypothetical protein ACLRDI_01905 [Pseudomonas piscis]|uniref:hypothetical protein n=1 Tax=Pseudomonas piscis TaxID=2614538 RepID=UPI0039A46786
MDIARLLRKRQLSVQEQNALDAHWIESTARAWQEGNLPLALSDYAATRGVDWSSSIVIKLEVDFPGMPSLFGTLLTQDEGFIDFAIETGPGHRQVESVERWEDVTANWNLALRNRGRGKGRGAIARQVRRRVLGLDDDD